MSPSLSTERFRPRLSRVRFTSARKVGLPPGKLVHVGKSRTERAVVSMIDYDAETIHEQTDVEVKACIPRLAASTVTWVNVDGVHDVGLIEQLGTACGIDALVLEDIVNTTQRPKIESFDGYLFIVLKMMYYQDAELVIEQVSLIIGPTFVLLFQERAGDVLDLVRQRLHNNKGRIRKLGPDYLAYALVDAIVDSYFVVLEHLGEEIDSLEERALEQSGTDLIRHLNDLKRTLIVMRKAVWPLREVVKGMQDETTELITKAVRPFLRDVYDHTIQVADLVETFRDLTSSIQDLYLSALSNRMNEVMKVLTIMGSIFIPLTFIAGVYGMNFEYMPELHWRYAYPVAMAFMAVVALGLVVFFRKKRWL